MLRRWLLFLVTYAPPAAIGAGLVLLSRVLGDAPESARATIFWVCFAFVVTLAFSASTLIAARVRRPKAAARLAAIPTLFAATAFAAFTLVGSDGARTVVAVIAAGALAAHNAFVAGMKGLDARYHAADLKHLNFALRIVSAFFAFYCAFRFTISGAEDPLGPLLLALGLTTASPAIAAALSACISGVFGTYVAWATLRDEHFTHVPPPLLPLAFGLLAFQFHLALAVLPVTGLTDAAVLLTLYATALGTTVLALRGAAPPKRNFALAAILVLAVLSTARWQ